MNRRSFLKSSAAAGAAALFPDRLAGASQGTALVQPAAKLPENPGFKTRHCVAIIYGNGCRKKDTVENPSLTPHMARMMREGTVFTEDFGETANLHGYMYTEMLTGRETVSEHPLYPTWTEYVRKLAGGKGTDYWMLQGSSYYRSWVFDRKHWSAHPEYGIGYGAASITMNKLFYDEQRRSPAELVSANIEEGLGFTPRERSDVEAWIADVLSRRAYLPASTKTPLIDREVPLGDGQCFELAKLILKEFKPRLITLQILALDDAHADAGFWDYDTDFEQYLQHLSATDELIGNLWEFIQKDPYLRETTALLLRPECGRDDEVNVYGQLHHSQGNYYAHHVWTLAVGPDFRKGVQFGEKVNRRDICPTLVYLLTGVDAARYATGSVRTQMFHEQFKLPAYQPRDRFGRPLTG
jgi:hypothetical protein